MSYISRASSIIHELCFTFFDENILDKNNVAFTIPHSTYWADDPYIFYKGIVNGQYLDKLQKNYLRVLISKDIPVGIETYYGFYLISNTEIVSLPKMKFYKKLTNELNSLHISMFVFYRNLSSQSINKHFESTVHELYNIINLMEKTIGATPYEGSQIQLDFINRRKCFE